MGKNKRRTFAVEDTVHQIQIEADSIEEVDFVKWLCEAKQLGIIEDFEYQPSSLELSKAISYENVDGKNRSLFREHVYTPDFSISFKPIDYKDLAREFKIPKSIYECDEAFKQYVDVKGTFAKSDGGRSFSINQKWVYDKYQLYIYKLVPKEFFEKFGVPEKCRLTEKTKKPSKKYEGFKSISECFHQTEAVGAEAVGVGVAIA